VGVFEVPLRLSRNVRATVQVEILGEGMPPPETGPSGPAAPAEVEGEKPSAIAVEEPDTAAVEEPESTMEEALAEDVEELGEEPVE
jgi:hypothetical protein